MISFTHRTVKISGPSSSQEEWTTSRSRHTYIPSLFRRSQRSKGFCVASLQTSNLVELDVPPCYSVVHWAKTGIIKSSLNANGSTMCHFIAPQCNRGYDTNRLMQSYLVRMIYPVSRQIVTDSLLTHAGSPIFLRLYFCGIGVTSDLI